MLNRIISVHSSTWKLSTESKKEALARLKMLSTKCIYKSYIFNIYVQTGFSIKSPTMVDMSLNQTKLIGQVHKSLRWLKDKLLDATFLKEGISALENWWDKSMDLESN